MALSVLLCLYGCGPGEPEDTEGTTATESTKYASIGPVDDPGSAYVDYDPKRELYIFCENNYLDIYWSSVNQHLGLTVLSRSPLDYENIEVTIPVNCKFEVTSREIASAVQVKTTGSDENRREGLPYYVYQLYAGTDFAALAELYKTDESAFTIARDAVLEDYNALPESEIPQFYAYNVGVDFKGIYELTQTQTFTEMDVVIDGQCYTLDIGRVNLHSGDVPMEYPINRVDSTSYRSGAVPRYLTDGLSDALTMTFTAEEDMSLLRYTLMEEDEVELADIQLTIASEAGSFQYSWDGESEISLFAGDQVQITAIIIDQRGKGGRLGAVNYHGVVDVEKEDGLYSQVCAVTLSPVINLQELYAIAFNGVDVEAYYLDYYYPVYYSWHEEYLNDQD